MTVARGALGIVPYNYHAAELGKNTVRCLAWGERKILFDRLVARGSSPLDARIVSRDCPYFLIRHRVAHQGHRIVTSLPCAKRLQLGDEEALTLAGDGRHLVRHNRNTTHAMAGVAVHFQLIEALRRDFTRRSPEGSDHQE